MDTFNVVMDVKGKGMERYYCGVRLSKWKECMQSVNTDTDLLEQLTYSTLCNSPDNLYMVSVDPSHMPEREKVGWASV